MVPVLPLPFRRKVSAEEIGSGIGKAKKDSYSLSLSTIAHTHTHTYKQTTHVSIKLHSTLSALIDGDDNRYCYWNWGNVENWCTDTLAYMTQTGQDNSADWVNSGRGTTCAAFVIIFRTY